MSASFRGDRRFVLVAALVLGVAIVSQVATAGVAGAGRASTAPARIAAKPQSLSRFNTQRLVWTKCEPKSKLVCSWLTVPRSYAKPGSFGTFRIRVIKDPATGSHKQYQGALMMNPGGPGSSGVEMVENDKVDDPDLHAAYDFVSFDPRGVGQSNPVHCLSNKQVDGLNFTEEAPDTPAEQATVVKNYGSVGQDCRTTDLNVYKRLSTASVARDMDVLRAALHQDKVNWFGFSYGTLLGEVYAELFPKHVRRMALDGVVPTDLTFFNESVAAASFEEVGIEHYFATCATRDTCPYRSDPTHGEAKLIALMASLRAHPIPVTHLPGVRTSR